MDAYDPATVYSSIDSHGRYAYANQPRIAQWNLARFAETLIALIDPVPERAVELATSVIEEFTALYAEHWLSGMRRKLGLLTAEPGDRELAQALLDIMHANQADFTLTFRALADAAQQPSVLPSAYQPWVSQWRLRLDREAPAGEALRDAMRRANPLFIPRNHRIERVINAAVEHQDFSLFAELLAVLSRPYEEQPGFEAYSKPPLPSERVLQTFCGT
jgi:uncharacterized protein YdiU (UPF0061 family)